jgi:hypothetical protein
VHVQGDAYSSGNQLNCCELRNGDGDDKYNCVVGNGVILSIIACWSVVKTEKRKGR